MTMGLGRKLGKLAKRYGLSRRKRYGHMSMEQVSHNATELRKVARENAPVTAAAVGAAAGALAAGVGVAPAAIIGAVTGVAIEEVTKK